MAEKRKTSPVDSAVPDRTAASGFRYERKFLLTGVIREQVERRLRKHPSMFSEIYHPRYVNNIYFDSLSLQNYRASTDGLSRRMKVRIRWYGDLFGAIEKPKLELKEKRGLVGRKHTAPVEEFSLQAGISETDLLGLLRAPDLPPAISAHVRPMRPVLLNRYLRRYWVSRDGMFRVTVDTEMSYYRMMQTKCRFSQSRRDSETLILELKYQTGRDDDVERVSRHFGCRLSKSSKYVTGMDLVFGFLQNA